MTQISFLTGQLILLGGWLLYRLAAFWKNKRIDWKNELRQIFFLINLLVILRFTFYPFSKVDGKVQKKTEEEKERIKKFSVLWDINFNIFSCIRVGLKIPLKKEPGVLLSVGIGF